MEQPSFMKVMSISTSLLFMLTLAVFGIQASENKPLLGNAYAVPTVPLRLANNSLKDKPAVLGASIVMAVVTNQNIGTTNPAAPTLSDPAKTLPVVSKPKQPAPLPTPTPTAPSNSNIQPIKNELPEGATIIVKPAPAPQTPTTPVVKPLKDAPADGSTIVTKDLTTLNKDVRTQTDKITSLNKRVASLESQIKQLQKQLAEMKTLLQQNQMTAQ